MPVVEDPGGDHLHQHKRDDDQQQRAAERRLRQEALGPAALSDLEAVRRGRRGQRARLGRQCRQAVTRA
jgi:hypothetical protein